MHEIRPARPEDAPALERLLGELGFPTPAATVAIRLSALLEASEIVLVALCDREVVGLLTGHVTPVLHRPTPVGRITALVVAERVRNQGIGRALVVAAERTLSDRGCGLVEVTSNRRLTAAHAFYERIGYEVTSVRFKKEIPRG